MLGFELCITHVLMQPRCETFEIFIHNVMAQLPDRPVNARPFADQAAVEFCVSAVYQADNPGALVPATMADPGALENEPQAVREPRTRRCPQLSSDLTGQ